MRALLRLPRNRQGAATQGGQRTSAQTGCLRLRHDDVKFLDGAGHLDLPQVNDNLCATCHVPNGRTGIRRLDHGGAYDPQLLESASGSCVRFSLGERRSAGKYPTVVFSVKDKSGKAIALAVMARLNLRLSGPTSDTPVSSSARMVRKADGSADGRYGGPSRAPARPTASGTYVVTIDGRRTVTLLEGTKEQRTPRRAGANKLFYFAVDGGRAGARRATVSTAKCNACHFSLTAGFTTAPTARPRCA